MGFYINPSDRSKEQWLQENGTPTATVPTPTNDAVPVCLVDNGPFTAAAICYDDSETRAFNDPGDDRPRQWFLVPKTKILEVCPSAARVIVA